MKKSCLIFLLLLPLAIMAQERYAVDGAVRYPDPVNPATEVFLTATATASIRYTGIEQGPYQWYTFDSSGSSSPVSGATTTTLSAIESDRGYYLTSGGNPVDRHVWLTNYAAAPAVLEDLIIPDTDDQCAYTTLQFTDRSEDASYYTRSGFRVPIIRKFEAVYTTFDTESMAAKEVRENIPPSRKVPAPLMDTSFKVVDAYAEQLGLNVSITSELYQAVALYASVTPEIEAREIDNEVTTEDGSFSAPVKATFTAEANEPVAAFFVWTVYKTDQSTTDPIIRYTDRTLRYTFENSGTYRVDLDVKDRSYQCSFPTISFEYTVVESFIDAPNVFSPGASPGVNDEFRVAYKSITKFKGIIVNRSGQKLFEWNDPAVGWDGYFGGKLVPPGVYFYVIEWEGADGRKGVKKGHINILRGRDPS